MSNILYVELVKMLWDMEEEYLRTARTLLDEGQIEGLERLLSASLKDKILLEIITWTKGTIKTAS